MTDPWTPPAPYAPPPRPLDKQVAGLALAILLLLATGVGTVAVTAVTGTVERSRADEREQQRQRAAADQAFDEALAGPPDTATASPAPDGSRVYASPAVEPHQHAFRLRLPRGWEGRHVGVREDRTNFSDSILLLPATGAGIVIYRVDLGARPGTAAFDRAFVASLKSDRQPVTLTSPIRPTTIGDEEPAYAIRARMTNEDGEEQRLRVVMFEHAGETFQVVQIAPAAGWDKQAPGMNRILASWRWG